jgi:hypothetical protein
MAEKKARKREDVAQMAKRIVDETAARSEAQDVIVLPGHRLDFSLHLGTITGVPIEERQSTGSSTTSDRR